MTKQEEIREGVGERLAVMNNLIYKRLPPEEKERNNFNVGIIISYLGSQGVVLKVDRDEPQGCSIVGKTTAICPYKEAGFAAIESLWEER